MIYEVLTASKDLDKAAIRVGVAKERPGFTIQSIVDKGDEWHVRIAADDDNDSKPDFLKKKKDDSSAEESKDSPDDSSSDDESDSEDSDDDGDEGDESKGDKKGNPVKEIQSVINELTRLFTDLGGKVTDLAAAHDDKDQALKDIADTAGGSATPEDGELPGGEGAPMPPDLEHMPDGPGAPPSGPRSAPVPGGKRRPGGPGAPPPGGGIPTFTHTEIAHHPGVDAQGNRLSFTQVMASLENDEEFASYHVIGLTANRDGTFSAKLAKKTS